MTAAQAWQRLSALCARSEHCRHDAEEKMRQWGVSEADRQAVTERLVAERYVDDERFARAFVHDKVHYNKWGRRKVEQALWLKHIDEATCRRVLDEVDDATYVAALRPLLQQKRRSTSARSDYELSAKLVKLALGRGFTMDIIRQCIDTGDADEFLD